MVDTYGGFAVSKNGTHKWETSRVCFTLPIKRCNDLVIELDKNKTKQTATHQTQPSGVQAYVNI